MAKKTRPQKKPSKAMESSKKGAKVSPGQPGDLLNLRHLVDLSHVKFSSHDINQAPAPELSGHLFLFPDSNIETKVLAAIQSHLHDWQIEQLAGQIEKKKETLFFQSSVGPMWIIRKNVADPDPTVLRHFNPLEESSYSFFRDQTAHVWPLLRALKIPQLHVYDYGLDDSAVQGCLVGFHLVSYSFSMHAKEFVQCHWHSAQPEAAGGKGKNTKDSKKTKKLSRQEQLRLRQAGRKLDFESLRVSAQMIGQGVNLARHLVNLPPNLLNPDRFSNLVEKGMDWPKHVEVEVWDHLRMQKERMNLHLAVGAGSGSKPRVVQIRIPAATRRRGPTSKTNSADRTKSNTAQKTETLAFVGKGVTFDSGGLDIKPANGMRLMKKDMGGAASLLGLAWVASHLDLDVDLVFILGLAENSIGSESFRPGDVVTARNGLSIEIHNTDAEGRLVLADCLDLAAEMENVHTIVDVATLTGAIKVALGAQIAGLFANDDRLAHSVQEAGMRKGDYTWRMPLYDKYLGHLHSHFAQLANASDGFGGAITAALFLQKFVKNKKWAHLDIYAWNDKADGALSSTGGSGQAVQMLAHFLEQHFTAV